MKKETLEEAADKWVFKINGQKWSNNDNTAGDNYGSFIAGSKWQQEKSYSQLDVVIILSKYETLSNEGFNKWFEKYKKK